MDLRDAFLKLKTRDKVALGLASVTGLTVVIMIFFFAFNGLLKGSVEFPESIANEYGKVQTKEKASYADLPYFIMYPNSATGVSVGGEEIGVLKDGTAFRFSREACIVAATPKGSVSSDAFIRERFYSLLCGEEKSETCTYIHKVYQEGYLNAEYLTYEGGILRNEDVSYYVLSYRQPSVGETDKMLAVVTTDKTRLTDAIHLLDRMWRTLCVVEEEYPVQEQQRAECEIEETFVVSQSLSEEEVVFYCDYNNVANTPSYAYLLSPTGKKMENPDSFNDNYTGLITFHVAKPEMGTWKLVVSSDFNLGEYYMMCTKKELFEVKRASTIEESGRLTTDDQEQN